MEGPPSRALATDRARAGNDLRVANGNARDAGVKKRGEDDDPAKLDLPGQHRGRQAVRIDEPHGRRRRSADAAIFRGPQPVVFAKLGPGPALAPQCYSARRARTGSMRIAANAGTKLARPVIARSTAAAMPNAIASKAPMPYNIAVRSRPTAAPISAPIASPATVTTAPRDASTRSTAARGAPSAMRMPISRVRRLTE